jgi:hypothetical protein
LGALNEFQVLDALIREIQVRRKKGIEDPRATYTVLLNRVIQENTGLNESSARPQTSRYLKNLMKEGYVVKEKIGRNVFYDVTAEGRFYCLTSKDRLDPSRKWFEEMLQGCYMSFAVVPPGLGIIREKRDEQVELHGKDRVQELVNQIKKMNPDLDSIYLRFNPDT